MKRTIKGTYTERNLLSAFAGESQARNRYTYFASVAKKEGYVQIAAIFEETANQESEQAKRFFKFLVCFPWIDPDLGQMKSIAYQKDICRVLLSTQGIGDNVYGSLVTHVTEKDGVIGSYNYRKHTSRIGNSTSPV